MSCRWRDIENCLYVFNQSESRLVQHCIIIVFICIISGAICNTLSKEVCSAAFKGAVDYINSEPSILPSTQIKYIINETNALDPMDNVQKGNMKAV